MEEILQNQNSFENLLTPAELESETPNEIFFSLTSNSDKTRLLRCIHQHFCIVEFSQVSFAFDLK